MAGLVVAAHAIFDVWLGWVLLSFRASGRATWEGAPATFLLGMYAETLIIGSLLFVGVPLVAGVSALAAMTFALTFLSWWHGSLHMPQLALSRPRWYEILLLLAIVAKLVFALWQVARTPLYFDDALTHWAGRSRALYGGVNWSFDPESAVFLGPDAAARHYPLLVVIWRAENALVCGGWDDMLARADGLLFFVTILASVWLAVARFSASRSFAALATFIVAAVPLQAWHAAAGYSDIAVEAFAVASLAALLRHDWLLAGVLAAGTAWAKNDGLVLFIPPLFVGACLLSRSWHGAAAFVAGSATLAPWLLMKIRYKLGVAPNQDQLGWHPDAPALLLTRIFTGPTSSIFWLGTFAAVVGCAAIMVRDKTGRGLLATFMLCFAALFGVYACTDSYLWLENQGTIHRTLLQLSALSAVIAAYGVWLRIRPATPPS
jgi:hypothetical protein